MNGQDAAAAGQSQSAAAAPAQPGTANPAPPAAANPAPPAAANPAPPAAANPAPPAPATGGFPLNRVVAFLGPYVALLSGAIASWLIKHFPGLLPDKVSTANTIAQGIVFVIGAGITWALQHKWLAGWQQWEALVGSGATAQNEPAVPAGALNLAALAALTAALPVAGDAVAPLANGAGAESAGAGVPGY